MTAVPALAERLAQSRERLRQALNRAPDEAGARPQQTTGAAAPWWVELKSLPGAAIVIEAAQQWWARHPLRVTVLAAINAVQVVARPVAQRHPFSLVLGAMVVGALLAWQRPWRLAFAPALWAGLLPQLLVTSLARAQHSPMPPNDALTLARH